MASNSDGIYTRKDRNGYWMHWAGAQGRRRWRKLKVRTLQQARTARAAELVRVEQAKVLRFAPPGEDTFPDVASTVDTSSPFAEAVRLAVSPGKRNAEVRHGSL